MNAELKQSISNAESKLPDGAQRQVARLIDGIADNFDKIRRDGLTVEEYLELKFLSERPSQPVPKAEMDAFFGKYGL